jgi:hypothetical protein
MVKRHKKHPVRALGERQGPVHTLSAKRNRMRDNQYMFSAAEDMIERSKDLSGYHTQDHLRVEHGHVHIVDLQKEHPALPYDGEQRKKLLQRAENVTYLFNELQNKYHQVVPEQLTTVESLERYITGRGNFSISYDATGELQVGKGESRMHSLLEANAVINNLMDYASVREKAMRRKKGINENYALDAKITTAIFMAAIGFGGIFAGSGITGNVVGSGDATVSLLGMGVLLLGVLGLIVVAWKH